MEIASPKDHGRCCRAPFNRENCGNEWSAEAVPQEDELCGIHVLSLPEILGEEHDRWYHIKKCTPKSRHISEELSGCIGRARLVRIVRGDDDGIPHIEGVVNRMSAGLLSPKKDDGRVSSVLRAWDKKSAPDRQI